jgi:hypothetical protein
MMRSQQRSRCVRDCVLVFVLVLAGCRGDELAAPTGESPRVASVAPRPNPANALAVFVDVQAEHADSVRVLFAEAGAAADTTPPVPLVAGRATVPVLGLRSGARYSAVTEVTGPGGVGRSDSLAFTGGELPELLRGVTITTTGAGSPGLNLTALSLGGAALFALAFDSTGSVRWYREFDDPRAGGELKQQPNGNFTIYIGASFGSQPVPGYYVEFSPTGDSLRAFTAPSPLYTDNHELWITGSGAGERIHLFGYDHRVTDITPFGGSADASLAGHSLVRLRPDGSTEFVWSAWDHLSLTDWIEPRSGRPRRAGLRPPQRALVRPRQQLHRELAEPGDDHEARRPHRCYPLAARRRAHPVHLRGRPAGRLQRPALRPDPAGRSPAALRQRRAAPARRDPGGGVRDRYRREEGHDGVGVSP